MRGSRNGLVSFSLAGALLSLAGLSLGAGACGEDTVGEGEGCETAQDCDGSLVCAKLEADGADMVCAEGSDTRSDDCEPGEPCGLVLKDDAQP